MNGQWGGGPSSRYGDVVSTVMLVRHGRTSANASGTLAGWLPGVGLDEVGLAAARAVGERLAAAGITPVRVVTSPLQRCQETAAALLAAFGAGHGIPLEADERLGECRYGAWTGRRLAELAKEPLWRTVQDHPSAARFPDGEGDTAGMPGESIAAMQARAVACVREIDVAVEAEHGPRAVWLAISHGDVIKAVLADAAGLHLDLFQRLVVDPASTSVVRYTDRRPFVVRVNDTGGGLGGVVPPAPPSDAGAANGEGADGVGGTPGLDAGDAAVGGGAGAATGSG